MISSDNTLNILPKKFGLCHNKLMAIFAALKYIRKSLGSYLFSEQMKDAFHKGVDIYIQRLFFRRWGRKMRNSWSYRPYLLCMKIMVRSQHTILSLEKLLEGKLTNKNQVLGWSLFRAKSFLKEETFPSQTGHLEPVVRMRSKCTSNSLCLTLLEVMQALAGSEAASDNPNYAG